MRNIFAIITTFVCITAAAQQTHYVDTAGNLYWNKNNPVYLFVSDNPDGKDSERLKNERSNKYGDPFYLDTEGINYIRTREAVDPDTKRVIPNTEVMFEIFADSYSPKTDYDFDQKAAFINNGILFYNAGVKLTLESRDELSGVLNTMYAVNGSSFNEYKDTLEFSEVSRYTFRYYSVDNVGNKEEVKELKFSVDPTPPVSVLNINGITEDSVVATTSTVYIESRDSLSGVAKVYYKFDDEGYRMYQPKSKISTANLSEGEHTITYYAVDFVGNKEEEKSYDLYLDRSPPLMVADILGDRFIVGDQVYFSGRTKLKLTAVDNKVGVKEIKYAIDDNEFEEYTKPFYLPSVAGVHTIRYYSVDNLDNTSYSEKKSRYMGEGGFEEYKHNVNKVYVDMTGPEVNYKILDYHFKREDTLFIGPQSKIVLEAADSESGLKEIRYSVNDEMGEDLYEEPFSFAQNGYNTLSIYGYDNVNNRNLGQFSFYCDMKEPEIFVQFNVGETGMRGDKPIYPTNVGIFLSATDKTAGVVSLRYKLDKAQEKNYTGLIKDLGKGKHTLVITAVDALNNVKEEEIEFLVKE